MSDKVEEKEEEIVRDFLDAGEALSITNAIDAESVIDIAVEKALNEVCKYVRTAAKAGYYQVVLEYDGLMQLPLYVEPRAKMLDIETEILSGLEISLLDAGYFVTEDRGDYIVSWVGNDD